MNLIEYDNSKFLPRDIDKLKKIKFGNLFSYGQRFKVIETDSGPQKIMTIEAKLKISHNNYPIIKIAYDFTNKKTNCTCGYCDILNLRQICKHTAYIIDMINNDEIDYIYSSNHEIEHQFSRIYERQLKLEKEKRRKRDLSVLDDLVKSISSTDSTVIQEKVHITPKLVIRNFDEYDRNGKCLVLKVGNKKDYIVRNIYDFLERIKNQVTYKYGKELEFNHNIKNFDKRSRKLIQLLQSNNNYSYRSNDFEITESIIEEIMNIYKGSVINVECDEIDYHGFILDEEKEVSLKIINNKLIIDGIDNPLVIPGYEYDYILDKGFFYKIVCEDDVRKLINFVGMYGEFDISNIQKEFIDKIYSRFSDKIDVDEQFKQETNIKELDIESYFDLVKDEIHLETKYYCDNEEIDYNKIINEKLLFTKLNKYQSILNNFGFVDGKLSSDELVAGFLSADLSGLQKLSTIYLSDALKKLQVKKFSNISTSIRYNSGMMNICFDDFDYSSDELHRILDAYRKKKRFVKLNSDTIVDLDSMDIEKLAYTVDEFNLNDKNLTEEQQVPLYQTLKLIGENDKFVHYKMDDILKQIINDIAHYKESKYEVPDVLKNVMRSYQVDAFKWMKTLVNYNLCGILADDMGLGKSLEIISLILSDEIIGPTLIVCPKSLTYNWSNEFKKWNADLEVYNVMGSVPERNKLIDSIDENHKAIYITSYDSLKNDLNKYEDKKFRFMILDEAQFIKNRETLKAKSVKQIDSQVRFVLTGTPIENTVVDLWSIFDFLMPNYLRNYQHFSKNYEKNITENQDMNTIGMLVKKITPFVLRRTKEDVLKDLPEKIEMIQYAKMENEQAKLYQAELLHIRESLTENIDKISILAWLMKLRQLCVDPKLTYDNYAGGSAKMELAMELINENVDNGHKILIFSQFTKALDILADKLEASGVGYFMLTGKTSASDRVEMAEKFNGHSKEKVFLISLKAGGTGLNLVGADVVIHLDPWWNQAAENQATDRAHRLGQKNLVRVIKLVCADSIEQRVVELQELKSGIASLIISDNDEKITSLGSSDIEYLLS